MTSAPNFTHEATTEIRFPSDREFAAFRAEVEDRYDGRMVRVERVRVYVDGRGTVAAVHHARGMGAEVKGLAYGRFNGHTINTIFAREE